MQTLPSQKKVPFGAFTLALLLMAGVFQLWNYFQPQSVCEQLKASLGTGYFFQYNEGNLLIVTSDRQQRWVNAENQESACIKMQQQYFPKQ